MPETNETIVAGYRSMKRIRIVNIRFFTENTGVKAMDLFEIRKVKKRWIRNLPLHPGCVRETLDEVVGQAAHCRKR